MAPNLAATTTMAAASRPEPMNATNNHPKVKVSLTLAEPYSIAGGYISGKMEMECKADKGLGIGIMMIELFAVQELSSRDHSALTTFIHTRRLFQGPGLPPSNAVQPHPLPGYAPLPQHYYHARKGHSTFLFRLPLPATCPSSIKFANGLAEVRYEVRASVGVVWKGERQLVVGKKDVEVVESFDFNELSVPHGLGGAGGWEEPEVTVVAENGKIWCQGRVVGGILVAGESACIELQVKNHSAKKNSSLTLTLLRTLHLSNHDPSSSDSHIPEMEINDTVTSVPFKGQEYVIPPGVEGVASLVFDVPKKTRGVRGGVLVNEEEEMFGDELKKDARTKLRGRGKGKVGLFEIRCVVEVRIGMGFGSKDIVLQIPVKVVHPAALPELPDIPPAQEHQYPNGGGYYDPRAQAQGPYSSSPYPVEAAYPALPMTPALPPGVGAYPALPMSPGPGMGLGVGPYVDPTQNVVWFPPPPPQGYNGSPEYGQGYDYGYNSPYSTQAQAYPGYGYGAPAPANLNPIPIPPTGPLIPSTTSTATALLSPRLPVSLSSLPVPSTVALPPAGLPISLSGSGYQGTGQMQLQTIQDVIHGYQRTPNSNGVIDPTAVIPVPTSVNHTSTVAATATSIRAQTPNSPQSQQLGQAGSGERASRISHRLRTPSQALGNRKGRSVSPAGARHFVAEGSSPGHPTLGPTGLLRNEYTGPGQTTTNNDFLSQPPPLHSPRPLLSPKHSSTNLKKTERVEELERMADEVGKRVSDLSGDLPYEKPFLKKEEEDVPPAVPSKQGKRKSKLNMGERGDYFSVVPQPNSSAVVGNLSVSMSDGRGGARSSPRSALGERERETSRSRSRTPPTPATPTLTAVATPSKKGIGIHMSARTRSHTGDGGYSTKAVNGKTKGLLSTSAALGGFGGNGAGRSESGLDALERKLLAQVGTRKVVDDRRPDVWSVLGTGEGAAATASAPVDPPKGNDALGVRSRLGLIGGGAPSPASPGAQPHTSATVATPKTTQKPSPIAIPTRRDSVSTDPFNDSAISSLTLPDCGPNLGPDLDANANATLLLESNAELLKAEVNSIGSRRTKELDEKLLLAQMQDQGSPTDLERDRDSDEKTHKGGLGSSGKKGKKKKNASNATLKDEDPAKDGDDNKERKSGKKRGKDRASASKGRVAAWLGAVEAEPPLDDLIVPSPSPQGRKVDLPSEVDAPAPAPAPATATPEGPKQPDSVSPPSPDPRSSGFVPIGTLKRDIYQRTLVPKDSPMASTNPTEDARRITDFWNQREDSKGEGVLSKIRALNGDVKNPWQSIVGKGRPENLDSEVGYDIRSARGGKGGRVTAVAAIWASGAGAAAGGISGKPKTSSSPLSPTKVPAKSSPSPFSIAKKLPISASSSSSSVSAERSSSAARTRPNVGGVKVGSASAPVPAMISSSHARPTLSTTASLARPPSGARGGGGGSGGGPKAAKKVSPSIKFPPTISELPAEAKVTSNNTDGLGRGAKGGKTGLGSGNAANNLRALGSNPAAAGGGGGGGDVTSSTSPTTRNSTSPTSIAGEYMAFGQARLRDLIKKYQGQNTS
ncbi:hypothetical protein D9757_007889 [Collybiopsis confluens]|uniref:Arrestin C-terminal-like domain-containing protein n=1 Tax=Collybiopsis confluens TaxID=2823264 RepID=A0A8H5HCV7_9AGAR|nr:hypothetical protein D9757_007889 [Collybiopsis confluens]